MIDVTAQIDGRRPRSARQKRDWSMIATFALVAGASGACGVEGSDDPLALVAASAPTYDRDVAPLLERYCTACHDRNGVKGGGVELDAYDSAYSNRYRNVCVSVTTSWIEDYADVLTPPYDTAPCRDLVPFSMPTGAKSKMSAFEQAVLVRWLETGAPR